METTAKVLNQRRVNGKLQVILELNNTRLESLNPSALYDLKIEEYKGLRSLDQNRKMWALINLIDKTSNGGRPNDPVEIYLQCLERANSKFEFLLVPTEALPMLKAKFKAVRVIGTVDVEGVSYTNVQCYYGSSKMNSKEMSDLIDSIIDYANELDIETDYWKEVLKNG